jgi:ABC-type amino acid transport substrate-binding protein
MNSFKNSNKELIKVFVLLGTSEDLVITKKKKDLEGKYYYTGFVWDIWEKVQFELKDKYNFKLFFSDKNDNNYDKFVQYVKNGKYDLVLGLFNFNGIRERVVDYCSPIIISANSIIYRKKEDLIGDIEAVFNITHIKILSYLVIFGLVFGFSLYYIDPGRVKNIGQDKEHFLLRSIVTGISSMIGQTGFLTEHSSLSFSGIILVVIILIVGFIFVLFFQGIITKTLIKQSSFKITRNNIKQFHLIGHKGYDTVKKIKRFGANIKVFSHKSNNEMVKIYLDNQDKYDGFVIGYIDGVEHVKNNQNLTMTPNFNLELQSFIVSQNIKELRDDINIVIDQLKYTLKLQKICESYFGNPHKVPVCML